MALRPTFNSRRSSRIGDNHFSLLLPVWVEKDWKGGWSAFGGGGCVASEIRSADFCEAGAVLTYQVLPKLQIGAELFHQTATSGGTPATSSLGIGWRYDLNENFHPLGYVKARDPEYRRDGPLFLVLIHSVHVLNEPGADRRSGSTTRGLSRADRLYPALTA